MAISPHVFWFWRWLFKLKLPHRPTFRGQGKLNHPASWWKMLHTARPYQNWPWSYMKKIGNGLCVLPSGSRHWYAMWHTTLPMPTCALFFLHCPYLICHNHLPVHHEAPVHVLCHYCFCCPTSKGLTISTWRLHYSFSVCNKDSLGSVP